MKKLVALMLLGIFIAAGQPALGQGSPDYERPKTLVDNPLKQTFSLLDPSRIKINHSYSFSYVSGGYQSGSVGMYLSSIQYQISRPLTLRVGLAYAHNPSALFGGSKPGLVNDGFYPSFQLTYRPSSRVFLEVGFARVPYSPYTYPYSPYYGRPSNTWWEGPTDWWRTR